MTARELLAWGDLEAGRRRTARHGLGRLPPWALGLAAGALLAGELARRLSGSSGGASQLWIAALLGATAVAMFGAPFRMYWRPDSQLLARLPVPGRALFRLALLRSARAALLAAGPCALAAVVFGPLAGWELALRHLALAGVAALAAAALAPAAALAAGALVASDKAQELVRSLGEVSAPKTAWLGLLPGLAATAMALLLIAAAPWAAGAATTPVGPALPLLAGGAALAALALLAADRAAPRVMTAALREVAALDQERLAHVDLSTPSPLERAWAALALRRRGARLVVDKDARLSRRRYPIPYFVGLLGVLVLWGVAAFGSPSSLGWSYALLGALAAYAVVMARRSVVPPIEHPGFLATLAVSPGEVGAAKRAQVALRVLVTVVLAGAPLAARAAEPVQAAAIVLAIAGAALLLGMRAAAIEP